MVNESPAIPLGLGLLGPVPQSKAGGQKYHGPTYDLGSTKLGDKGM